MKQKRGETKLPGSSQQQQQQPSNGRFLEESPSINPASLIAMVTFLGHVP
jgi:hypothetical protein